MRRARSFVLVGLLAWAIAASPQVPVHSIRFVQVDLRLLTVGDRQALQEVGRFSTSLPMSRPGHLRRRLTVENASKGTSLDLEIHVQTTPAEDDAGVLHCVVLSEATPRGGSPVERVRDLTFAHPGEQLMEIYADGATGTRVLVALAASPGPVAGPEPSVSMPPLLFLVKVEQWCGAQRVELESLQLQSLDGKPVEHRYSRRIPRWTEGGPGIESANPLDKLKVLDFHQGTPTVTAGEGFSIPQSSDGKDKSKPKKDEGKKGEDEPPPKVLVWDEESYRLELVPGDISGGRLTLKVKVVGQILDPVTRLPMAPVEVESEKRLLPGQPAPFYLTRQGVGGDVGYVVWVVPRWDAPPDGEPPAGDAGPSGAPLGGNP